MVIYFIILLTIIMFAVCSNVIDFGNETITENLVNQKIVKSSSTKFRHFRLAVSQEKICRCSFESDALRLSILAVATILILHIPKRLSTGVGHFFCVFVHLFLISAKKSIKSMIYTVK